MEKSGLPGRGIRHICGAILDYIGLLITSVFHLGPSGPYPLPMLGLAAIIVSGAFFYIARVANDTNPNINRNGRLQLDG